MATATVPSVRNVQRRHPFPRLPLFSAMALIAFAVAAIVFGQTTGMGTMIASEGRPVDMTDLVILQPENGGDVIVRRAATGEVLAQYAPGEGGFVSGSVRALARMRLTAQAPAEAPYRLIRWENGSVSLSDTVTGQRIYLNAFGPDNVAAFAQFLGRNGQ